MAHAQTEFTLPAQMRVQMAARMGQLASSKDGPGVGSGAAGGALGHLGGDSGIANSSSVYGTRGVGGEGDARSGEGGGCGSGALVKEEGREGSVTTPQQQQQLQEKVMQEHFRLQQLLQQQLARQQLQRRQQQLHHHHQQQQQQQKKRPRPTTEQTGGGGAAVEALRTVENIQKSFAAKTATAAAVGSKSLITSLPLHPPTSGAKKRARSSSPLVPPVAAAPSDPVQGTSGGGNTTDASNCKSSGTNNSSSHSVLAPEGPPVSIHPDSNSGTSPADSNNGGVERSKGVGGIVPGPGSPEFGKKSRGKGTGGSNGGGGGEKGIRVAAVGSEKKAGNRGEGREETKNSQHQQAAPLTSSTPVPVSPAVAAAVAAAKSFFGREFQQEQQNMAAASATAADFPATMAGSAAIGDSTSSSGLVRDSAIIKSSSNKISGSLGKNSSDSKLPTAHAALGMAAAVASYYNGLPGSTGVCTQQNIPSVRLGPVASAAAATPAAVRAAIAAPGRSVSGQGSSGGAGGGGESGGALRPAAAGLGPGMINWQAAFQV